MGKPTKEQLKLLDIKSKRALRKANDVAPLTQKEFEQILKKAAQPLHSRKTESDLKED